ncbi:MAG: transglycosylase domain-containing protein, partial [Longimicrobiales bacterium]
MEGDDIRERGRGAVRRFLDRQKEQDPGSAGGPGAPGAQPGAPPPPQPARSAWRRALAETPRPTPRQMLAGGAALFLLLLLFWERCGLAGCPSADTLVAYQPGNAPVLLDRDGEKFADLAPVRYDIVPLEELPEHVAEAFIAVEDQRFREHDGVDWHRVGGAFIANVKAGGAAEGASTITMQLARNIFPERLPGEQKTLGRKLLEVRVAGDIEDRFSKDEILELYLNHIYFGGAAYGIEAAARSYFRKPASELTLAEAATLAGMPKAPNTYNPRRNPELARERRRLVLDLMVEQGRIEPGRAEAAADARLRVRDEPPRLDLEEPVAPYFVWLVRRQLEDRFGDELYATRLRVHTTLDLSAQRAAERELRRQLARIEQGVYSAFDGPRYASGPEDGATPYLQGAIVVLDADSGGVLALVGGRDWSESTYNRAVLARRQIGSAFKPFVFAAALADGYAPSQHLADAPLHMELAGGEIWEPQNYDGSYAGEITLRESLVRSKNVPTVRLAVAVGTEDVAGYASEVGNIDADIPTTPSMALGTVALSPLDLAAAYTAFANGGRFVESRLVTHVEGPEGDVVWVDDIDSEEVMDPSIAYLITDILAEAVDRGTGTGVRDAGFRGAAAGKTGTTDDGTDAWFVGYTPDVVGAVWIGFDEPRPITRRASGGRLAAPVWGAVMRGVYADRPAPREWMPPEDVIERQVDPATGLILAEGCRPASGQAREELFIEGTEPAEICPEGGEEGGPGVFDRVLAWARGALHDAGRWVAGLFGREEGPR